MIFIIASCKILQMNVLFLLRRIELKRVAHKANFYSREIKYHLIGEDWIPFRK